jgi:hypothetical protein
MNDDNEGEQILKRLKAADDQLRDAAIEEKVEEQRAFAVWFGELSSAAQTFIGPKLTKRKLSLWRKADVRGALWEIRRLTED